MCGSTPTAIMLGLITDYRILERTYREALSDEVRRLIGQGWQPLGGITVMDRFYVQAIVRTDTQPRPDHDLHPNGNARRPHDLQGRG